jgi:hypothetical protein
MLKPTGLSLLEILLLIFTATMVASGIVIANIDIQWFEEVYVVEDGFVENWTVVPLLIAAAYAIYVYRTKRKDAGWRFKLMVGMIALFSLFVAGEEISWGQRLLGHESSAFFREHNAQGETNLHNMVVGGKKINKIVFSQLLVGAVGCYLFVLPFFYRKHREVRRAVDAWGIPVPQFYQTVACCALFLSILLIPSGKNAEILEAGITSLFLLILLFPYNSQLYRATDVL